MKMICIHAKKCELKKCNHRRQHALDVCPIDDQDRCNRWGECPGSKKKVRCVKVKKLPLTTAWPL